MRTVIRWPSPDGFDQPVRRRPLPIRGLGKIYAHYVGHLPVAAPELIHHDGRWYVAALTPQVDGIRIAELDWVMDE